jgi:translation initiation factor IF-1
MYEAPIIATAEVTRMLKPNLYELRLPNGKLSLGHYSKKLRAEGRELNPGAKVILELTPFDFDSARISAIQKG